MKRINWPDLFQKLVDPYDMNDTLSFIQKALGDLALSMSGPGVQITPDFLAPFPVTMSGSVLGGDIDGGIALDDNGQLVVVPADDNNFTITAAHASLARWDLLVLVFSPTPDTPIPKPTDPLTTVYQYLLDGFVVAVRAGTPSGSPAYPTKTPGDVILAGLQVPAAATLGTSVTVDLTVREQGYLPASKFGQTPALFNFNKSKSVQTYLSLLDAFILAGAANISDDGATHDYAEITCNSVGVNGDTVTLGATTLTIGSGAGQIPIQATAALLALAVARALREDATVGPVHYATASPDARVGITAKAQGAVGTALSKTGTTFSVSAASLSGNAARSYAVAAALKRQVSQLDAQVAAITNLVNVAMPYGALLDWPTETAPSGWIERDGASYLRSAKPLLFAAIGTRYGAADGTHFNVPDDRGMFRRGWAHGQTTDPDRASRTAPTTTGATISAGDHVGTIQTDQFKLHVHHLDTRQSTDGSNITSEGNSLSTGSDTQGAGGNETRPLNVAYMGIIRSD